MAFGKTERMFSEDILVKKQKKIFVLSSSLSRTLKDGQSRWLDCLCTVHITTPDLLWCDEAHGIVGTFFHTHVLYSRDFATGQTCRIAGYIVYLE